MPVTTRSTRRNLDHRIQRSPRQAVRSPLARRRRIRLPSLATGWRALLPALAVLLAATTAAEAQQSWGWPWETQARPRVQDRGYTPPRTNRRLDGATGSDVCLRLEQQLANISNSGRAGADERADLSRQISALRSRIRRDEARLERQGCWEEYFFQRTLRNTRNCVRQDRAIERQKRRLANLMQRRDTMSPPTARTRQDDIIRALADNRCGRAYEQQARRLDRASNPFSNFFQDYDSGPLDGERNTYRGLPFATYRTLCVRLCDGYYFPVSFSTLPNYFQRDVEACQSRCAAPVALYYHQNPGGSIDQMISVSDNSAYTKLKTAFLYRKKFVNGCSCKAEEYSPDAVAASGGPSDQTAEVQKRDRGLSPIR